jgi:hypothetical protein
MKNLTLILVMMVLAITLVSSITNTVLLLERKHEHQSMITIYTPENIYYLTGRDISDENGDLGKGYEFTTRNHAIQWLEQRTAYDCNQAIYEQ